jgi:hypothetical protein
MDRAALRIAT